MSDGAVWIWNIVRECYSPCIEIIDWWHALQKLWVIAWAVYGAGTAEAAAWVETLKGRLWAGQVRELFHAVRQHWPRGQVLSEELRHALGYLRHHRQRMPTNTFGRRAIPSAVARWSLPARWWCRSGPVRRACVGVARVCRRCWRCAVRC